MGHIHPVFLKQGSLLNGQRVWLHFKVKKEGLISRNIKHAFQTSDLVEIVVIPSFNKYLYAISKKQYKKSISPIISRVIKQNAIEEAYITTLDGSLIGDINSINDVL
jgi:metallophosphoesterase superfamily enzyme